MDNYHVLFGSNSYQYFDKEKKGGVGDLVPLYISYNLQTQTSSKFILANLVKDTLNEYLASSDEEISEKHIPPDKVNSSLFSRSDTRCMVCLVSNFNYYLGYKFQ